MGNYTEFRICWIDEFGKLAVTMWYSYIYTTPEKELKEMNFKEFQNYWVEYR